MKKVILTGSNGFLGHHIVEHILKNTDWHIYAWDKLNYASMGYDRIREIQAFDERRIQFFTPDITREISDGIIRECKDAKIILHAAAETHVDRSIEDPKPFVYSNVVGTMNMLDFARKCDNLEAFWYCSTDEVFGPALPPLNRSDRFTVEDMTKLAQRDSGYKLKLYPVYKEWDRYNPTNPYSASKAGAEALCLAYMNTYNIPGFITNCMNLFGERQHPEKFIPLCIRKILKGESITIHGTKDKLKSGSRFYIHARNTANAVLWLIDHFDQRDKYNIVGEKELTNLEVAQKIADILGKPLYYEIVDFHSSRPGHDLRYGLDGYKLKTMGYKIPVTIDESLRKTVEWTVEHPQWLEV